jgi:hypothetical protein
MEGNNKVRYTVSNYFTDSNFLMRCVGLMKWYQFSNFSSKVTSIMNKRPTRSEGSTSSTPCNPFPLSAPQGYPTTLQKVLQPTLGIIAVEYLVYSRYPTCRPNYFYSRIFFVLPQFLFIFSSFLNFLIDHIFCKEMCLYRIHSETWVFIWFYSFLVRHTSQYY